MLFTPCACIVARRSKCACSAGLRSGVAPATAISLVNGPGAGGSLEHADNLQNQQEQFLNSVSIAVSAGRTVVAVRGFHKFCVADGLATADPAAAVRPPSPARRLPKALPLADVEAILDASGAAGTTLALRDRALLEVLYGTGARIS